MANAFITPSIITREALTQFKNNMTVLARVDRQHDKDFRKVGDTIKVRRAVMFDSLTTLDATGAFKDVEETSWDLVLNQTRTVPLQIDVKDFTLTIEEFSDRYIKPAAIELVQQVELSIFGLYSSIYNFVGTPGTTPGTVAEIGAAKQLLDEMATPFESRARSYFGNPASSLDIATNLITVNPSPIASSAIEDAMIGRIAGFNAFESQSVRTHTVGAIAGTIAVDGTLSATTYAASKATWTQSITLDTTDTSGITDFFKAGDVITIAGCNAVNPKTRESTGSLQTFVVTADADAAATTGNITAVVSPPMITSGPYQTVDAVPADDAAVTVKGSASTGYPQNLAIHRDAITVAFAPFQLSRDATGSTETMDNVSMTYVEQFDATTYKNVYRLDILYGVLLQIPQFACRVTG